MFSRVNLTEELLCHTCRTLNNSLPLLFALFSILNMAMAMACMNDVGSQ